MVVVYVSGLPFQTTEPELKELFLPLGTVYVVRIIIDRATGKSRGFGFVKMRTQQEAKEAISALNGADFGGRRLQIAEAHVRRETAG